MLTATSIIKDCTSGLKKNYRADVDGLRALACLAVVIYHAFPNSIQGGFVGVDIFFVISGFIISSILYRNLFDKENPGRVNIIDFYIKRVRRIFPALIAVLVFVAVAGYFILLPDEYRRLGTHIIGGSTYISNIILYLESGSYFNTESNQKALLHLWSLGVEEQFYLFFPLILWVLYRCKLSFIKSLIVFSVISFITNIYFIESGNGSHSFYMVWTRFWELSFGAILAFLVMFKHDFMDKVQGKSNADILSTLGIILIIIAYATIPQDEYFPGYRAMLPVLGAVLIIAAGPKAFINHKILSSKLFVFLGLISYSLYLWHWPLLAFDNVLEGSNSNSLVRIGLVVVSIVLATLTFYFIEPPLRYGKGRKLKSIGLFTTLLLLGVVGFFIHKGEIAYKNKVTVDFGGIIDNQEYAKNCLLKFPDFVKQNELACYVKDTEKNDIDIIGDSHTLSLANGLFKAFENEEHALTLLPVTAQCPFYNCSIDNKDRYSLYKLINQNLDFALNDSETQLVVLTHYPIAVYKDEESPEIKDQHEVVFNTATKTFKKFKDKNIKVLYLLDIPTMDDATYKNFKNSRRFGRVANYTFSRTLSDNQSIKKTFESAVVEAAKGFDNVKVLNLSDYMCKDDVCPAFDKQGNALYIDTNHLSVYGSKMIAPKIKEKVLEMVRK